MGHRIFQRRSCPNMDTCSSQPTSVIHVAAMPFPGRGHINPMMNFCKLLASSRNRHDNLLITVVVTEEWLGYIGSAPEAPLNIRLATLPNVVPPERLKAVDFPGFYEAVMTKMEEPFEELLDRLEPPVALIIGDVEVRWAIGVGNRRNIPVAAFWTMSASFFSMLYGFGDLYTETCHDSPLDLLEQVECIPGLASSETEKLRTVIRRNDQRVVQLLMDCISRTPRARYLIFTSVYELEPQVIDTLKATFSFPVYSIGPAIPYLELKHSNISPEQDEEADYTEWLNQQPPCSVLYVSLGSFLSVSSAQMDEIAAGLKDSGVGFLWVARAEASRLKECCGDKGLVVAWCDQLKVLYHPSVGGFWTHCGWNSTLEAVFAGVPMITFPLFLDQDPNNDQIVEEWGVGWRMECYNVGREILVSRGEISRMVRCLMDPESHQGKKIRVRSLELRSVCLRAISGNGSSTNNLDAFISDISSGYCPRDSV